MNAQANQRRAAHLLAHYLRQVYRAAGMRWDSDNDAEVDDLVECIIDAARCEPDHYPHLAAAQERIAQLEVQFETARAGQRHGQARIAEIEAQLAERGEYVPVDVAFIRCDDGHYLQVEQQTVAVGPYGKHSVTAFDLPEPYYICRRVQREDDSL